jgi:hypothetical protein
MFKKMIWRYVRSAIALGLGSTLQAVFNQPMLIWLAPVINSLGKVLREKYPGMFDWIPV